MNIGIACYPTYGGSGVVAAELGKTLAERGHRIHFISYAMPIRLDGFSENIFSHTRAGNQLRTHAAGAECAARARDGFPSRGDAARREKSGW